MSQRSGTRLVKLILGALIMQLLLIAYVFGQAYEARLTLVEAQRAGCRRANEDRKDNAKGWRISEVNSLIDGEVALSAQFQDIAIGLETRSRIPCNEAYPTPGLIP